MSENHEGATRKEFMTGVAVAGAAAATGIGFTRQAAAQDDKTITQTATIGMNPEKKEEAQEAISTLVKAVEANEPDVLAYVAHFMGEDKIFFFEIYKDQAALDNHGKQPHMAAVRQAFMDGVLRQPLEVKKLERIEGFAR